MGEVNKTHSICYVAGKSGGHIVPCLTQAEQLLKRYPQYKVIFFSTTNPLDQRILSDKKYITSHIALALGDVPYSKLLGFPLFIWQSIKAFFVSLFYLYKHKPKRVVTTGGFCAVPVCLAARALKIPIELQLLDVVPGRAIRFLSRFAQVIGICFQESVTYLPAHKCLPMNYPVRFTKHDALLTQQEARQKINLASDRFTIFILGGSQGSVFLNSLIKEWLLANQELHKKIQIIHQTGAHDNTDWTSWYQEHAIPAFVFSYYPNLNYCYRASDIVICRAGAGVLFELSYFKTPCIIIPLKSDTTTHQRDNALAFAQQFPERCTYIAQEELKTTRTKLSQLLQSKMK